MGPLPAVGLPTDGEAAGLSLSADSIMLPGLKLAPSIFSDLILKLSAAAAAVLVFFFLRDGAVGGGGLVQVCCEGDDDVGSW